MDVNMETLDQIAKVNANVKVDIVTIQMALAIVMMDTMVKTANTKLHAKNPVHGRYIRSDVMKIQPLSTNHVHCLAMRDTTLALVKLFVTRSMRIQQILSGTLQIKYLLGETLIVRT